MSSLEAPVEATQGEPPEFSPPDAPDLLKGFPLLELAEV